MGGETRGKQTPRTQSRPGEKNFLGTTPKRQKRKAEEDFVRRFRNKEVPEEVEELSEQPGKWKLVDLLNKNNLTTSKSEARRLIEQGGVQINGERQTLPDCEVDITEEPILIKIGKRRFYRLRSVSS